MAYVPTNARATSPKHTVHGVHGAPPAALQACSCRRAWVQDNT